MFTGIIEEIGTILAIKKGTRSAVLTVKAEKIMKDIHIGDSIAVNGVCLTVISFENGQFDADIMPETLNRSSLGQLKSGSHVNLERAMAADGRFGGHIVAGHIDGTGTIHEIKKDDNAVWYTINAEDKIMRYIIEKGSVAIDGISLTVAQTFKNYFKVSIIPHTMQKTVLEEKKKGDIVNLENDCVGKYVEHLLGLEKKTGGITVNFLRENGF
ncbi:MAG: riboflavin synthase [Lachnospiraceae bacterium]|jgi:riboflavin synthase, alpha subunit|nr:riboflavin synthase [Lachnospiraceae bacterium]MCI9371617.1 riboflavin synthase [Lachnospiraceae bacterium]MDE7309846.1 riboflavin synthase [Lachnospiraceae bacterium]